MNNGIRMVIAAMLAALACFFIISFGSYNLDQVRGASPVSGNLAGPIGAWVAHHAIGSWGLAAFILPLAAAGFAVAVLRRDRIEHLPRRMTGVVCLLPVVAGLMHLLPANAWHQVMQRWDMQRLHGLGGNVGWLLVGPVRPDESPNFPGGLLSRHLDTGGSLVVLLVLMVACLLLVQINLWAYLQRIMGAVRSFRPSVQLPRRVTTPMPIIAPPDTLPKQRTTTAIREVAKHIQEPQPTSGDAADLVERIRRRREALERGESGAGADERSSGGMAVASAPAPEVEPLRAITAPPAPEAVAVPVVGASEAIPPVETSVPTFARTPVPERHERVEVKKKKRKDDDDESYQLPPVELLDHVPLRDDAKHEAEKNTIARMIEETFSNFGISVSVVSASRGPVLTMYEMSINDVGMRVNRVEGFEKDLAIKLGTDGIRIVAPLPNKKTIGVEVPNRHKEAVVMRDLVEQCDASQMTLPLILGRDVVGAPLVGDLSKMPHLLVAGATGTGKSVCMNAMICSILLFRGPDEVKFIMVDPKMVELAGYEDIPHLLTPPITDMTKAHAALEWACRTMDERYFALRLVGVRDIKAYNELGEAEIRVRLAKKGKTLEELPGMDVRMSFIIVLVDEYADLMMVNKEVEKSLIRLAAKSRAAGLHLILTTQRPSADVVTGLIKSNLPARLCFRVADKSNSRVVLDSGGAECLIGKGDMLYLMPGTSSLVRGQGVWVKDKEIEAIIEHAKSQGTPQYDESICAVHAVAMVGGGPSGTSSSEWISDTEFHAAVQAMYRYNRTGADFFRRKLNIGYNKATGYVELLEDLGFVGPGKSTASREILKSWDDWIDLLKENNVTWDEENDLYHNPVQLGAGNPGQE